MSQGRPRRDSKFTMLLTDEESRMLAAIARSEDLSAATCLRRVIRERYAELAGRLVAESERPKRKR